MSHGAPSMFFQARRSYLFLVEGIVSLSLIGGREVDLTQISNQREGVGVLKVLRPDDQRRLEKKGPIENYKPVWWCRGRCCTVASTSMVKAFLELKKLISCALVALRRARSLLCAADRRSFRSITILSRKKVTIEKQRSVTSATWRERVYRPTYPGGQ